ncbi:efflux RND transporter periplasmic adaptor subunit [Sphingobacterium sp. LRF_L2]|uniref:efflux RND transporter periplasmic adaptor subunit n=1 Tax=Sphingobacterium sp. LRF_L2 TaxID=3369421 RepID=UPI003F5E3C15
MKTNIMLMGSLVLFALNSCNFHKDVKEESTNFLVSSPLINDTTIVKQYVSQVRSIRHIEVRSQERGYLEKVMVDEGQFVHKGQLLFQIMPKIYNAELLKAQAETEATAIELQNIQTLADKNVVAPNELAMAKAKLKKAQAEMELASAHLEFTKITAPYDGIIDHLDLKLGSLVDEGDLLTTLSDNSTMWVYYNVPETEYLNYKTNASDQNRDYVQLLLANQEVYKQAGKVETIEADFNNETGNIAFRATFPNPDNLLRNGQTGSILMSIPLAHAIIIPQKASFEIMDKKYVYVVDKDNKVKLTPITIKAELPDLFIVQSGLKGDEKILLEGIRKVQNGDKIEYTYKQPREVLQQLVLPSE